MRTHFRSTSGEHQRGVVFVVDDDEDQLRVMEYILERAGYLVLAARNGEEALTRMHGISGPSAAVVDLLMPKMDGWQLIEAMKGDVNLARIPIITCSGHVIEPVEATKTHLRKPVKTETLFAALEIAFKFSR